MDVLFLGGVFDNTMEKEILKKSKGTVHYAANKLQWNLIEGLLAINNLNLEILSAPFIGTFPKEYEDIQYKGQKSIYKNVVESNYVGFNNTWGYRSVSRKNNLIKGIKSFAITKGDNKVIIVYSPHTPFLQAAVYAKKIDPTIHICLVVPDLPQFMNLNDKRTLIYDRLKKIDIDIFEKNSKFVDSFVLLTEPMKNMLNVGERPYVVVEGAVKIENNNNEEENDDFQSTDNMTVVYTGTLNKKFGVVSLVEAFHNTSIKNTHLKICGRGDSEEIIKSYAAKDERIVFLGQLPNTEAVKLQKRATVLVNPRQNNEEFTKYSFPSKNMEYLLTGRPVIAYKLDGIPDEYDNYFHYVEDDSIDSFTNKIEEILLMDEKNRSDFGNRARSYVLNEKNNISASKKIIDMIQKSRSR
ncbi:glycosyltransferase [Jeotgalibaca arthritidis]|uniref:Glycosyltransferase family 4 protein n=1 Tax=Jeotgalibaca arthritidis TaxID=1868794 RepID=A0A6G7KB07_9LACT|nr:glycosyltransferase [Jeotgalibaca arthritidis]QII82412.1 glycosyltransferase family 4 protein [Jeotgalibaca arthritidis]